MAEHVVPHFHNDPGVQVIEIGAKEFMCVGATPPYDHPHVFLDMGEDNEIICPIAQPSTASTRRSIRSGPPAAMRVAAVRSRLMIDRPPWRPRVMSSSPEPVLAD